MAAQILKCRRKTITNEWQEKRLDVPDQSRSNLTPVKVDTLDTPLSPAHSRGNLEGTWRQLSKCKFRDQIKIVVVVIVFVEAGTCCSKRFPCVTFPFMRKRFVAWKIFCLCNMMHEIQLVWIRAQWSRDKITLIFNVASCALFLHIVPATTQKSTNIRLMCTSLRIVPPTSVLHVHKKRLLPLLHVSSTFPVVCASNHLHVFARFRPVSCLTRLKPFPRFPALAAFWSRFHLFPC